MVMVYSASAVMAMEKFQTRTCYLFKQVAWALIGLRLVPIVMRIDYRNYRQPAVIWTRSASSARRWWRCCSAAPVNGATRWLGVGGARRAAVGARQDRRRSCSSAALLERRMDRMDDGRLFAAADRGRGRRDRRADPAEPDLGTAVWIADDRGGDGLRGGNQLPVRASALLLVTLPAFYLLVMTSDIAGAASPAFLDPWADPLGDG